MNVNDDAVSDLLSFEGMTHHVLCVSLLQPEGVVTAQALVAQMSAAAEAILDEKGKRVAERRQLSRTPHLSFIVCFVCFLCLFDCMLFCCSNSNCRTALQALALIKLAKPESYDDITNFLEGRDCQRLPAMSSDMTISE